MQHQMQTFLDNYGCGCGWAAPDLRGKSSEKGEGVSHPIGHVETPKTP